MWVSAIAGWLDLRSKLVVRSANIVKRKFETPDGSGVLESLRVVRSGPQVHRQTPEGSKRGKRNRANP